MPATVDKAQPLEEDLHGPLGYDKPQEKGKDYDEKEENPSEIAFVKQWSERIRRAKGKWENDFKRMRRNMDFVAGYQRPSQQKMEDQRYIANFTIRAINQKVATLYARNPTVVAKRRKRLDFQMWDGKMETIMQALAAAMMGMQSMGFVPPEAMALLNDFQHGRQVQQLVEKIGTTLEYVTQYQMDSQEPDFKTQAKQWVRRAAVCGVAYMKIIFHRYYEHNDLTQSDTKQNVVERVQRAKLIMEKITEGKIDLDNYEVETLKNLINSIGLDPTDYENVATKERIIFDFPPATAIIPDDRCRILKGFVGAHWLAEEFYYPLDFVNAMFDTNIKPGGDLKHYDPKGKALERNVDDSAGDDVTRKPVVCLWQVYDKDTKSTFVLVDGYKCFVMEPETLTPATKSFWIHFPLVFNDVEVEQGCKATIFPPSDVQLLTPMQQEWNRIREALRAQRKANAPKYMVPKGHITENDKTAIEDAEDNQVIELEGLPSGADPSKILVPLQVAVIDPAVYDTKPLQEDSLLATGQQEANVGPAQPNVTATVGTIAEQSRMTVAASNVDDLDDCLSSSMKCVGEMLIREMSTQTVQHIAGVGAVWPEQQREDFLNEIELQVQAASSGRPNKAIAIDNWTKIMPLILQAAQMPPELQPTIQACIRESIKVLDASDLDPADFFPLPGPPQPVAGEGQPTPDAGNRPAPRRQRQPSRGQGQMNPPPNRVPVGNPS